jgi:hypothetical protein
MAGLDTGHSGELLLDEVSNRSGTFHEVCLLYAKCAETFPLERIGVFNFRPVSWKCV